MMRSLGALSVILSFTLAAWAAAPSFRDTARPDGWTVVSGVTATGAVLQAGSQAVLHLSTAAPVSLPVEAVFRFRANVGDRLTALVLDSATNMAKPLLRAGFRMTGVNQAQVTAQAEGEPMATTTISDRTWSQVDKKGGSLTYAWRFPRVKNLWDERDRREIGADYADLVPFEDKVFTLRLVLAADTRQIWLDDRLVAEERSALAPQVFLGLQLDKTARVLAADFRTPEASGPYLPLSLAAYSHGRAAPNTQAPCERVRLSGGVPVWLSRSALPDVDLGQSLYRYRLTHGSGPDTGYVNAQVAWPAAFKVDPASLTFRVPHRPYRNAWLVAWLDDEPHAVPRGALRFFRENAGYPAATEFAITEAAIKAGLVTPTERQTPAGKPLYLVKVPLDTDGLYGLRDLADQFLDFELTKPLALQRSYPDPIYYGYHPAGWPSAVHVVGITLEEAAFDYEVRPTATEHVFERPVKPGYTVAVTNPGAQPLKAMVSLRTRSHDGREKGTAQGSATIAPHQAAEVRLELDLKRNGWHALDVCVEAGGQVRSNTLALVVLPPNTRTYGAAANETRFGIWALMGHYVPLHPDPADPRNEAVLAMLRTLGLRRFPLHEAFASAAMLKRQDFLPTAPHTVGGAFSKSVNPDGTIQSNEMAKAVEGEVAHVAKAATNFEDCAYFYGGEWHIGRDLQYAPWPHYTGDGDRDLNAEERANAERHVKIFTAIGRGIRARHPSAKLILQWGAPLGSLAYMRAGMPRDLVDFFGMDAPQFELLPELSNITGSINQLWALRQEAARLGWPNLPIAWCEGPFFPTNPGALTEDEQAAYQIRYWLLALAYGVELFEAGVVPHDAGNYYGAEHYGAGVFHRRPLEHPKPAVAALATATAMLCGADVVGPVDTGCPTTYCLAFRRAKDPGMLFALWRVNGTAEASLKVAGGKPVATDAMGNAEPCPVRDGAFSLTVSPQPVWLTGVDRIEGFAFAAPRYDNAPARIVRPLPAMTAEHWTFDGTEDKAYAYNHFAIRRITDTNLTAAFDRPDEGHGPAAAITLPVEPADRPLATRYGRLTLKKPAAIPGRASALGVWVKGNSSWGRVVYQCRDAKGETWTSVGTKDDWNCDDTHAWSYVSFEGWRYVRFPLPGSHPYDNAHGLEITWWGCRGGDGIVDLPLALETIIVEARNEVPVLGVMTRVPDRTYQLAGLAAEYESEADATDAPVAAQKIRLPLPDWKGPADNPIARLAAEGVGEAPTIAAVTEPEHFNDGRRMKVSFTAREGCTHNLYLSRYRDGRGADLLKAGVKDGDVVTGFRPETPVFLFLTALSADKKESKPSPAFNLVTHDNFAEK